MFRSVSLTAKKMLDLKQIFVVLTNPVYSALFSVFYTLEKRTVFEELKSQFLILICKMKFSIWIISVIFQKENTKVGIGVCE